MTGKYKSFLKMIHKKLHDCYHLPIKIIIIIWSFNYYILIKITLKVSYYAVQSFKKIENNKKINCHKMGI